MKIKNDVLHINIEDIDKYEFKLDNYEDIIDNYAKIATKRLKSPAYSPVGHSKKHYKDRWKYRKGKTAHSFAATVYNKDKYQLTHLLENGHLIVNKRGSAGWASSHPHIHKVYDELRDDYISDMSKVGVHLVKK